MHHPRWFSALRHLAAAGSLGLLSAGHGALAAEPINIIIDFAKILTLNGEPATLVVGNPGIADVALEGENRLILTGRAAGTTNLIALDRDGQQLANRILRVSTSYSDVTTVYYGSSRRSYSCSPICEQIVSIGDDREVFDQAAQQIEGRNSFSSGAR